MHVFLVPLIYEEDADGRHANENEKRGYEKDGIDPFPEIVALEYPFLVARACEYAQDAAEGKTEV